MLRDIIGDDKRVKWEGRTLPAEVGVGSLYPGRPICSSEEVFLFCDAQGSPEATKSSVGLCLGEGAPLPCLLLLSQGKTW